MKKLYQSIALATLCAFGLTSVANAHTEGAHVHGEAQMAIIIDGESVAVSLNSAMYNITGFERAPNNEAETEALASAIGLLEYAMTVVTFNSEAGCTATSASHSLPKASVDVHDHDHNPYRDLEAEYGFTCSAPEKLSEVSTNMFASFERLEKIDLIVLLEDDQIAGTLTAAQTVFSISD